MLIFILSSLLTSALSYRIATNISTEIASANLDNTNRQVIGMIETAAETSLRNYLKTLSESNVDIIDNIYKKYAQGMLTEAEAKEMATEILLSQRIGKSGYFFVVNSQGKVLVHPKKTVVGSNYSEYDFIQKQIDEKRGYLKYTWKNPDETDERDKALYMVYMEKWDWIISASAYRDEFSSIVNIDDIYRQVEQITIGNNGYVSIIDSNGLFIIHPSFAGRYSRDLSAENAEVIDRIITQKNGSIEYSWKNQWDSDRLAKRAVFDYLPAYDWYVVSTAYVDEMRNPFRMIQLVGLLAIPLGIIGGIFAVYLFKRQIVKPVQRLKESFEMGLSGDYSSRIPVDAQDEMGALASYYNQFMENLESAKEDLENALYIRTLNEQRAKQLLDSSNEGFLFMTKGLFIVETNEAMARLLGKPTVDILGRAVSDVLGHRLSNLLEEKLTLSAHQCSIGFEQMLFDPEKDKALMVNVSSVTNASGAEIGYFAIFTDVTALRAASVEKDYLLEQYSTLNSSLEEVVEERTQELRNKVVELTMAQEKLIQSEKLSSLGIVVSGLVNQLNSPLGNSITMTSYIENQCTDYATAFESVEMGDECKELVKDLLKSNVSATQMVLENLKKATRVINGLKHVYPETIKDMKEGFDLRDVIDEILSTFEKDLRLCGASIKISGETAIDLYTYKELLKQILSNLTDNAVKHGLKGTDGGTFSIDAKVEGADLVLTVGDDGNGMPSDQLEKVFEPFYKISGENTSLGLGLYTVYNLINMTFRGSVKCNSMPGFGTQVVIKLPGVVFK